MKEQFASYFDKPEFKHILTRYEEMLQNGANYYFEDSELTDIAEYYAMLGDSLEAERALDYALRLHPDSIDALIFKARARLINGQVGEAIQIAEKLTDNNDREVLFLRAELMMATEKEHKANDIFRALIELERYSANTYVDIIDLLLDNQKEKQATLWLEEAIARHPENPQLLESAAYCHILGKQFTEAIDIYNRLLDTDAYNIAYWEELGKIYFQTEQYDKAIESFEFAIAINDKDCYFAMHAIANSYFNIGNYEKAEEYYQHISHDYPGAVNALYHMGICRINMNDDDKALEYLTEALVETTDGTEEQGQIYSQLSLIFSRKGEHKKAVTYIEEALKIYPDNQELIIMKGHELLCQGHFEESNQAFVEALNNSTENAERSLFLIGVSMLENGLYSMSYYILRQLKDNPEIDPSVLYPYLCMCEWVLNEEQFKETLSEALVQCPQKTYEIFTLEPAQGESVDNMIQRLKAIKQP